MFALYLAGESISLIIESVDALCDSPASKPSTSAQQSTFSVSTSEATTVSMASDHSATSAAFHLPDCPSISQETSAPEGLLPCSPSTDPSLPVRFSPASTTTKIRAVDISPYPKCMHSERRRNRSNRAENLTSSPYKRALEERETAAKTPKNKGKKARKMAVAGNKPRAKVSRKSSACQQTDDFTPCGVCSVRFCDDVKAGNGRKWIECTSCGLWFHNECQGLDSKCRSFKCIACEN